MAEENENKDQEEQAEETPAEETPAAEESEGPAEQETPAEESEAPAEETVDGDAESGDHPAEPDAGASEAETTPDTSEDVSGSESGSERAGAEDSAGTDEDELSPKERRRLERSRASGPPGPQRSAEARAQERAERRRAAAERRRRYRSRRRERRGEPGSGTPPAERVAGKRKVRVGKVISNRAAKTITVRIERARRDTAYEKVVRRSSTVHAHDERDEANEGDVVRVVETRPLSRSKRWRLLEIVERAR